MSKFLAFIIALTWHDLSMSQSQNDIGKMALSIIMPENVDYLDEQQLSKLETKISQIVTMNGLAASGYNNNFVIYPKLAVYENNIVESGMQNITVMSVELSLFIKQVENNLIFSTITKSLKGSGNSKQMALTNAISKIPTNDLEYKTFIENGKLKILHYYELKCTDILKKSEAYVKLKQYDQALGLLLTVPEEVSSCYSKVQEKSIEAYIAYQTQKCAETMQSAKTTIASNNYVGALKILSEIDPSASCFKEAQKLINLAAAKIDAEEKKQWEFKMKQYKDLISLNRQRIEAAKEIAIAYYKNRPSIINYNYIVR